MSSKTDPTLAQIVAMLRTEHGCHTILPVDWLAYAERLEDEVNGVLVLRVGLAELLLGLRFAETLCEVDE